ncbi:MAG TPA: phosphoribosylformylglycinamidine synthase subunit PurL [Anaerolineales bacterium]
MSTISGPEQRVYRFIVAQKSIRDARSAAYLQDARTLGLTSITAITCSDLYFIQGSATPDQLDRLGHEILLDPVTESVQWQVCEPDRAATNREDAAGLVVEVTLRAGVTDPVAEQIVRAAHILSITGINAASTGQHFVIKGANSGEADVRLLADRLLCNPVIQRYTLGEISPAFPTPAESTGRVETIRLRGLTDGQLLSLSVERRAALDLAEMKTIQAYCESEQRDLTDVEFEMLAQTWSEHCVHKTFKARITLEGEQPEVIDNLFTKTIQAATRQIHAPWVRSAFADNAGIIDYDGVHEISFKVETHNHPSAIEPFGGANTGIGGVIRDVIGVSARPIAATDVLCFGPAEQGFDELPAGVLHPRRIASGVVAGIQDYGNKIGIPTVNGAILYDRGYTSNPLVFCGCAGIAPLNSHPPQPLPGDHIIVTGGRTGRDGLRGATFSSMTMDAQTGEVAGASVQIGAPIVEKGLIDVTIQARDRRLYHAITDCGAGGLSSAVGEMASACGGAVQLERVPLKYPGLAPWEIWLSEAQERMVMAVPPAALDEFGHLCDLYEVEWTDIGEFNASGRLVVRYHQATVLDLDNDFMHAGLPQRQLSAVLPTPLFPAGSRGSLALPASFDYNQTLLSLLAHPNIASKEQVIRLYDHEVQGGTVIKPLTGMMNDGPSDASLIRPRETRASQAVVISAGINPEYGKLDSGQMALNVIDEAIRNAVAVGADPDRLAILDNFCWGDPRNPYSLGELVAAALACRDGAIAYRTPFISGKDSFNNEYLGKDGKRHAIPPTLLISAIGVVQNWAKAVTMDLKRPGGLLYLVGPFAPTLGGNHVCLATGLQTTDGVPSCSPAEALAGYQALHRAVQAGRVLSLHDLSEGGLAVAAAEMCIGGRLGLSLRLPGTDPLRACFGETTGCLLAEVAPQDSAAIEALLSGLPWTAIGEVRSEPVLTIHNGPQELVRLSLSALIQAWRPAAQVAGDAQ